MSEIIIKKIQTSEYNQFFDVTKEIEDIVEEKNLKNCMLTVISPHTTCGIFVNEGLECLEKDIEDFLNKLAPEDGKYYHARMLQSYGSTAGNPTGHLKSLICGNHAHFLVVDGKIKKGDAQRLYFCEFDGPSQRKYYIFIN